MRAIVAATTSPRLCGGMLVAIPTAMPVAPLISKICEAQRGEGVQVCVRVGYSVAVAG